MATVREIGEFGLIEEIRKKIKTRRPVRLGIGDDAAVLAPSLGKEILFTTDMLIEDRHFRLKDATAYQIGWKSLAVNISDIAAMGGLPTCGVVSLGLPADLEKAFVDRFYRGLLAAARRFKVQIVGGDTNASDKLVVSVALLGEIPRGRAVRRKGARVGDVLFVSGDLGGSYVSGKHLRFIPRVRESQFLVGQFKVHSMIDISDGLSSELHRLAEESGVGAWIEAEAVPVSKHAEGLEQALTEGEDFELLFSLSPKEAVKLTLSPLNQREGIFHPIGKIVEKKRGVCLVSENGVVQPLAEKGFDHFR